MKNHVKIALEARQLSGYEPWFCEICLRQVGETRELDCHHVEVRGMGGNKAKDRKDNLILCHRFPCHADADANRIEKKWQKKRIKDVLERAGKPMELIQAELINKNINDWEEYGR